MALLNQSCIIHYGMRGDISRFILKDDVIYDTVWQKGSGIKKNGVIARGVDDMKACSDGQGSLFLFCTAVSGDIEVFTMKDGNVFHSVIKTGGADVLIRDIRPYFSADVCELLISHSKRDNRNERVLTKYTLDPEELKAGIRYPDHCSKDLMEYGTFGPADEMAAVKYEEENSTVVSVIEKGEDANSIILLKENRFGYVEGLIKISMDREIFWHDIHISGWEADVVYTVKEGGGFSIKHMVYDIKNHRLSEEKDIRTNTACSHPLIVKYRGEKRVCWYEKGAVYSRKKDSAGGFENAVKRKESAGRDLHCAHFILDDKQLKNQTGSEFRKVFLIYPDNIMTGF